MRNSLTAFRVAARAMQAREEEWIDRL